MNADPTMIPFAEAVGKGYVRIIEKLIQHAKTGASRHYEPIAQHIASGRLPDGITQIPAI